MIEITVALPGRGYPVFVGRGLGENLPALLDSLHARRVVVVAGRRVLALHGRRLAGAFRRLGAGAPLAVNDGERYKTPALVGAMHDGLLERGLARDGVVVALGGGVVGDAAGFAAATYMRGVRWVVVPTTLLSMVDSAIGGKVGVNHPQAKNLIGAFHQPRAVISDTAFLDTLPIRELRSGAYEILKCGVIGDPGLFQAMTEAPAGLLGWTGTGALEAIAGASRLKAEVVAKDEHEGGLRRVLNLGHTLGHALETVTRYRRFTHGEAVGWGLIGAAHLAHRRGLLADFDAVAAAVDHIGPRPPMSDLSAAAILAAVGRDKKAKAGKVPFILPTRVGDVVIHDDVTPAELRDTLRAMGRRESRPGGRRLRSVR
jgi:3-dehydroquinate synthase